MPIVRLKPFSPQKGHRLRQLVDGARDGKRYVEGLLYPVTQEEAVHLSWFMQDAEREDPKVTVYGKARAFDVFATPAIAQAVLDEETRGALFPNGSQRLFQAPDRNSPEAAIPADLGAIEALPVKPPTALERRQAAIAGATAKKNRAAKDPPKDT